MNVSINIYILFITITILAISCTSDPSEKNDEAKPSQDTTQTAPFSSVDTNSLSLNEIRSNISEILLAYYSDLSKEKLSDEKYFAERVEYFFGKRNITREEVIQSIRNGFASVENRTIQIDTVSIKIKQQKVQFVAEFSGQVKFTRASDQSLVDESFYNQVTFNDKLKIVRYESLEAHQDVTQKPANIFRKAVSEPSQAIIEFLDAWTNEDKEQINTFIYPQTGFYYITRPGAMDAIYQGKEFEAVFEKAYTSWTRELLRKASCEDPREESLPEYDCENFSKAGCFIAENTEYEKVSYLMDVLVKNDLAKFSNQEIQKAKKAESLISHQVVITSSTLSMCWGKVDDKWYIIVLDIASYDCSA